MRRGLAVVLATLALAPAVARAAAVDVQAHLDRARVSAGESTTLQVIVGGAGSVREPEFQVPDGIEVLGSVRAQNFSWINGKSSVETVFRYELGSSRAGSFTIGPVRVHSGDEVYSTPPLVLEVVPGTPGGGGGGAAAPPGGREGPARLVVDVTPRDPWLGQPTIMRVSLIQRQALAEDPQYGPPSTTGFWAEPPSRPTSFYSQEGDRRVLVTQTRSRLYPLAPGVATIGSAVAGLTLASGDPFDPFRWPGSNRRHVEVRSDPVQVRVRPLPRGAPPGFDGAVGNLDVAWTADRARTSQDVALSVRLDVRGVGNLPMIHTPALNCPDCEIFTGPVEDSLADSESDGPSRRSFRWTVLPRHTGALEIPPPAFAWFDPASASYHRAMVPALSVTVDPPVSAAASAREVFPPTFADHPVDPFAHPALPLGWALGGFLLGSGVALWRAGGRRPADAAERARQREWARTLRSGGPEFWRAAEDVCAWLEAHGRPQPELRADMAAARYAAGFADPERFRDRIAAALEAGRAGGRRRVPWRAMSGVAALAGLAVTVAAGPRWGPDRGAFQAQAADARARAGDMDGARQAWRALWNAGARAPGLAARLAWSELRAGSTAEAAAWALRGDRGEARDPALRWVWERVRESGGLTGAAAARLPVRTNEWAAASLVLGLLAGALWPRRSGVALASTLALACATVGPIEGWRATRRAEAVVRSSTTLGEAGLELEPGQVVRVRARAGGRVRVAAGRDVSGWIPAAAVEEVD